MTSKFLFFDMDGTLISRKSHHILPSSVETIQQAIHQGHKVFLCTGRGYAMAKEYEEELKVPGIIFANGAGIAYNDQILEQFDLDPELVNRMVYLIASLGGGFQILGTEASYQNEKEHERFAGRFVTQYPDLTVEQVFQRKAMKLIDEYQNQKIQKIDFNFESELTADIFFARIPANMSIVTSGGYYAGFGRRSGEVMAQGITKGYAIQRVVELFGGSMHDTYGFGDSANDITMLQTCAVGIAMGNGSEEIQRSADYVTNDSDHDGIANALKHFELI